MITALHIERVFDREDALGLKACSRRRCRWEDLSVLHFMTVRYRADGAAAETQPPPCAPPEPRTTGMLTMAAGGTTADSLSVEAADRRGLDAAACEHAVGDCEYDMRADGAAAETQPLPCAPSGPRTTGIPTMAAGGTTVNSLSGTALSATEDLAASGMPLAGCRIASPDTMLRYSRGRTALRLKLAARCLSSAQRSHGSAITQPEWTTRTTETPQPQTQRQAATPRFAQTRRQQDHNRMRAT